MILYYEINICLAGRKSSLTLHRVALALMLEVSYQTEGLDMHLSHIVNPYPSAGLKKHCRVYTCEFPLHLQLTRMVCTWKCWNSSGQVAPATSRYIVPWGFYQMRQWSLSLVLVITRRI